MESAVQQCAGHPLSAGFRRYREVKDLTLPRRHGARYEESDDAILRHRHQKIVIQIVRHVPVGCARTGLLNGGDRR